MAYSPPDSPSYVPPLPPFPPITQSLQWRPPPPPPPPSDDGLDGRFLAGAMAVVASLLVIATVCRCRQGYSSDGVATAAASAENARTSPRPSPEQRDDERLRSAWDRPSVPNPTASLPNPSTASLPAFRYSRSVKHNLTDGDEEAAATCSVCLGAFQLGEMVRLLPVCLHLYHVQCIDPWLAEHSTCPLCRSDTDRTMGVGQLPLHQTPRPEVRV